MPETRAAAPVEGPVRVFFVDVDGTLTDGVIGQSEAGEARHFFVRDGLALQWAREFGVLPVVDRKSVV